MSNFSNLSSLIRPLSISSLLIALGATSACLPTSQVRSVDTTAAQEEPVSQPDDWESAHKPLKESQKIVADTVIALASETPIVLGYFTNWSHARKGNCSFATEQVDTSILTHINYAFALVQAVDENDQVITEPSSLDENSRFEVIPSHEEDESRLYGEVVALKKKRDDLKVLLSIGGWAFNDEPTSWIFTQLADNAERRGQFIRQATKYARRYGFDGIDIDWEFPGTPDRGGRGVDKANFTALLSEFRAHMHAEAESIEGQEELLLTIASPAGDTFYQHQELNKIHESLNWINVMTYDYHGGWDKQTGANAPLSGGKPDIQTTIADYKAAGIPANKLVLGIATYARSWGGVKDLIPGGTASVPGPHGECGEESLRAGEVQAWVKEGRYQSAWDDATQTPYAFNEQEQAYISYENPRSIELKLDYLAKENLAGAMFWAIDLDEFRAGYPMISQVYQRVMSQKEAVVASDLPQMPDSAGATSAAE